MLKSLLMKAEDRYQRAVASFLIRAGQPVQAFPLPALVMNGGAYVQGRVLVRRAIPKVDRVPRSKVQLLRANLAPFITFEVPGACVRLKLGDQYQDVLTDREGYFAATLDAAELPPGRHQVIATPLRPEGEPLQAMVHVPDPNVSIAIVSDIDDTIIDSGVAHGPAAMLKATLLTDATSRVPLEGAPTLYRALARSAEGADRPFVYLSTSPWNLADFLMDFLRRHNFPAGPILLTDWGPGSHGAFRIGTREHKLAALRRLATGLPNMRFVLLGDSGQADAEIYATFATEYPGRVAGVYIRRAGKFNVARQRRLDDSAEVLRKAGVEFLIADDSEAIMRHASAAGLVSTGR